MSASRLQTTLGHLRRSDGLTPNELAPLMGCSRQAARDALKKLRGASLAHRVDGDTRGGCMVWRAVDRG